MRIWLTILGMALVTYATRALPLLTWRRALGATVEQALRYVPPAIFAAPIVPALLAPAGRIETGPAVWAWFFGAAVVWRTRSMALTVTMGLGVFAALRFLGLGQP